MILDTLEELEDLKLEPDQSILCVMDRTGDIKTFWSRNKPEEVEVARATYEAAKKKGYNAYRLKADGTTRGEQISEFDPNAERITMALPLVGG